MRLLQHHWTILSLCCRAARLFFQLALSNPVRLHESRSCRTQELALGRQNPSNEKYSTQKIDITVLAVIIKVYVVHLYEQNVTDTTWVAKCDFASRLVCPRVIQAATLNFDQCLLRGRTETYSCTYVLCTSYKYEVLYMYLYYAQVRGMYICTMYKYYVHITC